MKRMVIGIDSQFIYHRFLEDKIARKFPYSDFRNFIEADEDEVLEMYAPVVRFPPATNRPEDVARVNLDFQRVRAAFEAEGVSPIESPGKPSGEIVKHSDDQRLMIRLAFTCTRLKPDFLVLVAADGDYAPLVWGLREEGIRTKLITHERRAAKELLSAVYSVSDLYDVLKSVDEHKKSKRY